MIIGDSMLNNINSRGLSSTKKAMYLLWVPGVISTDIFKKMTMYWTRNPITIHVGANDLTNDWNLPSNAKKIVSKTNKTSHNTSLSFAMIIFRKQKGNIEKTNSRLNVFCKQNNIRLLSNDKIKEEHLGSKKLHRSKKGHRVSAKNSLNFIEGKLKF